MYHKQIIGIDASRCRSGGAVAHIKGILCNIEELDSCVKKVVLWSHKSLLEQVPDSRLVKKICAGGSERSIASQLLWQKFSLSRELKEEKCDILFSADASTLARYERSVVLSQDMLSYEPGIMKTYGWSRARIRLEMIRHIQNNAFQSANAVIFLTNYASRVIQQDCGDIECHFIVPHGIDEQFRVRQGEGRGCSLITRLVYISNFAIYKHHPEVVEAVRLLRDSGMSAVITLAGGGGGEGRRLLDNALKKHDPSGSYVFVKERLGRDQVLEELRAADIFLFASSCENLPVTLLEGMAAGLPVVCSNRGPMPEVLGDAGIYFDPECPGKIATAIQKMVSNSSYRQVWGQLAYEKSLPYSWRACRDATFEILCKVGSI